MSEPDLLNRADFVSEPQSVKAMPLSFATITLSGDTLSVRFSYEPYKHDLKILLKQWWLPMMIYPCVVVLAFFCFNLPTFVLVLALQIWGFVTLFCATLLYQIARNSIYVANYIFDGSCNVVSRNGIVVSLLSETEIILQTRLGMQGNRRFRLALRQREKPEIILVETPLLEDQNRRLHFYGQTHAENVRTMFRGWIDDTGRRDAVNERDLDILASSKEIQDFVGRFRRA